MRQALLDIIKIKKSEYLKLIPATWGQLQLLAIEPTVTSFSDHRRILTKHTLHNNTSQPSHTVLSIKFLPCKEHPVESSMCF